MSEFVREDWKLKAHAVVKLRRDKTNMLVSLPYVQCLNNQWLKWGGRGGSAPCSDLRPRALVWPPDWIYKVLCYAQITPNYVEWVWGLLQPGFVGWALPYFMWLERLKDRNIHMCFFSRSGYRIFINPTATRGPSRFYSVLIITTKGHCESSLGSFYELQNSAQAAVDPQTKPPDLGCESTCRQLSSTTAIAIVRRRVEGWVDLDTAGKVHTARAQGCESPWFLR